MKVIRCDKSMCRVFVPYGTLVLLPRSNVFEPITRLPVLKRFRTGVLVEIPRKSVLRIGKTPNAKYYLLDGEFVELEGMRAKVIGMNVWGWHYFDPRTNEKVVTVIYTGDKFIGLWAR